MPLKAEFLPLATPFDPAEDPPGSIDPLGTLASAERLADILLPGFTARMWRTRLLTFTAINAVIADRVVALMDCREDIRLDARLAFERLYVSAIVRMSQKDPAGFTGATRRLPGNKLAENALFANEPLTRNNFLKAQAVNGPFGVMARLARNLELVDEEGHVGRNAISLLLAWSEDEDLPGVLDEDGPLDRAGAGWVTDAVRIVASYLAKRDWPSPGHRIWEQLATHIRPDQVRKNEERILGQLLEADAIRRRVLAILRESVKVYRDAGREGDRGTVERTVLLRAVKPVLVGDSVDRLIGAVISAVDAYENVSALLQQTFDGLVWALKNRGGRADIETILSDTRLRRSMERTLASLVTALSALNRSIKLLERETSVDRKSVIEPLIRLQDDVAAGQTSIRALAETILSRHERVQREKQKGVWIERESQWTLMPGFGIDGKVPPIYDKVYLHPFRVPNAYSVLSDLNQVSVKDLSDES